MGSCRVEDVVAWGMQYDSRKVPNSLSVALHLNVLYQDSVHEIILVTSHFFIAYIMLATGIQGSLAVIILIRLPSTPNKSFY